MPPLKRGRWVHQRQAECFSLEESFQLTIFCNTTGLPQLAKKPYEKALKLATSTKDLSVQAGIQAGLGKTYRLLGNEGEAVQWLEKAKVGYGELGDGLQVQKLAHEIDSI